MTQKVQVSREVAGVLDFISGYTSKYYVIEYLINDARLSDTDKVIAVEAYLNESGYEIEKTPEENVAQYYRSLKKAEDNLEASGQSGAQFRQGWQSVEHTLELLGLKIEGVHA